MYSGPIPPADELAKYGQIIPNGPDRIVTMAEDQQKHRHKQEDRVIRGNVRSQTLGTIFGFIFGMTGMILGYLLVSNGKDASGLTALIGSMVALIVAFIRGRSGQEKERRVKREAAES